MNHFHIDFETFSEADLKKCGSHHYANHPSTKILCCGLALNDEKPVVWRADGVWASVSDMLKWREWLPMLEDLENEVYAFNATGFEIPMTKALWYKTFGTVGPHLSQWRCVQAMARRACLPAGLDKLAEIMQLKNGKDKAGHHLINTFSKLQKPKAGKPGKPATKRREATPPTPDLGWHRIMPRDKPVEFQAFADYCAQDVVVEREAEQLLQKAFGLRGVPLESFLADAEMNLRGIPVNLYALRRAQEFIESAQQEAHAAFRRITGFGPKQNEKVLEWLQQHGFKGANLQANTLNDEVPDDDDEVAIDESGLDTSAMEALHWFRRCSFAATAKVKTMLAWAGPHDNMLRGTLSWHTATTGRWGANGVQPMNMKRSTDISKMFYAMLCEGLEREDLELLFGPILEQIAGAIRHFIHDVGIEPEEDLL